MIDRDLTFMSGDGYTATVTLSVGEPTRAVAGVTNGQLALGSACAWDYAHDGVVPFRVTLTNTTPGFSVSGEVIWTLATRVDDASAEVLYGDGPACLDPTNVGIAAQWSALAPNDSGTQVGFFRLGNFATPNAPEGDIGKLEGIFLYFRVRYNGVNLSESPMVIRLLPPG